MKFVVFEYLRFQKDDFDPSCWDDESFALVEWVFEGRRLSGEPEFVLLEGSAWGTKIS